VPATSTIERYLARYALLPTLPILQDERWRHVVVLPAYDESPELLDRLPADSGALVILVLNRPDTEANPDVNDPLRAAVVSRGVTDVGSALALHTAGTGTAESSSPSILMLDLDALEGALPSDQGVGRARRLGADLALWLYQRGHILSHWLLSSDADATLPVSLLSSLSDQSGAAVTLPFVHSVQNDAIGLATLLYELRLHQYVAGLQQAGSPYAFHTLGSACAFSAEAYAKVRGVPLRNAAEDFYLLNKIAKVGAMTSLSGTCITIDARVSDRVPFGTGPSVARLVQSEDCWHEPIFYHPGVFQCLGQILKSVTEHFQGEHPQDVILDQTSGAEAWGVLLPMGVEEVLDHCWRQGRDAVSRERHFHTWLDGFRTLKLLHGLRDSGLSNQSFVQWQAGLEKPAGSTSYTHLLALRQQYFGQWGWLLGADFQS